MKFNIEVELDWVEEGGDIDSQVKEAITQRVIQTIEKRVVAKIEEKVSQTAEKKADDMCQNMMDEFINKKITTTDRWGDAIATDTTIKEILKKRFDSYWDELVDKSGRDRNSSYSSEKMQKRFQWLIDQQIEEHAKKFSETLVNDTEDKIKATLKKSLQDRVGAKIVTELGFDKLLLANKN